MSERHRAVRGDRDRGRGARRAAALLCVLAVLGLVACGRDDRRTAVSKVAGLVQSTFGGQGAPVLRVGKTEFTNADFRAYLDATGAAASGVPAAALSRLFDRFVDEAILFEAARERGIVLTDEEKKEYLAKLAVDPAAGGGEGLPAVPPEGAFDRLLVEKYTYLVVRDVRVDADEILAYYEGHKKDFLRQGRVQVSQILVDSEEKAVSVVRRLERTGEDEFRRIAREESLGPEAARGGVMGVFAQGDLPADMERAIFAIDEGRTSQVVESSYGFHIFRLDRKVPPSLQTEAEAAPEIRQRIMAQKMKEALALHLVGLKDTLSWESFPRSLFFAYQRSDE